MPLGSAWRITGADVALGLHLLAGLPRLLRRPVSHAEAVRSLAERLARREADFLTLARRAIYPDPRSPYRRLLDRAGCRYGDLENLVRREGVEGALRILARHGVYLGVDEFKGRAPAIRGATVIAVEPESLCNSGATGHLLGRTSGSRGSATLVPIDLSFVRELAVDGCLDFEARGGSKWVQARWTVPGGDALAFLLMFAAFGARPARWFSQVDPATPGFHPRYRWSAWAVHAAGWLVGRPLPRPQHAPFEDPGAVLDWLLAVRRARQTPNLVTYVSSAVQLCRVATGRGVELEGVRLSVMGEPITATRLATIRRAGAEAVPYYGSVEAGLIGTGCLRPAAPDDVHIQHDLVALVQPGEGGPPALPPDALLLSSLRPTAPLTLLNVSLGDRAVVTDRRCGCPLEGVGWPAHLHTIRSFEKLTAGGMTFPDADVIRALETDLPARFGGGPADYQLVEGESADGQPCLTLVAHPRLGPLEPQAVVEVFLTALGRGSAAARVMERLLRGAAAWRLERWVPRPARSGKILHLHQARGPTEGTR